MWVLLVWVRHASAKDPRPPRKNCCAVPRDTANGMPMRSRAAAGSGARRRGSRVPPETQDSARPQRLSLSSPVEPRHNSLFQRWDTLTRTCIACSGHASWTAPELRRARARRTGVHQSYLMYLNRGSSGVPSSALSAAGRQLMVSSILRASWKSLSVIPFAEWVTSLTITKA